MTERLIIANQNRILALLDSNNSDYYNQKAQIAERGYEGLYNELFSSISDGVTEAVCEETHDILTMFLAINGALDALNEEERDNLDTESIAFEGFDGNNDDHYHFATFLVDTLGRYRQYADINLNSHTATSLPRYRQLLDRYNRYRLSNNNSFGREGLLSLFQE